MLLRSLALERFRNYASLELEPQRGLNVFVGPNAQGKSNLLEAIALLGTGKSFRADRDADMVSDACDSSRVRGEAQMRAGSVHLACAIQRDGRTTRKTYTLNARPVRYAAYLGKLQVVTFVPTDLQLAGGAPGLRRAFLNAALAQTQPGYYRELVRYRKTLQQKNALLRDRAEPDAELLGVYDRTLVDAGTPLVLWRANFVQRLSQAAARAHAGFTGGRERFEASYEPDVAGAELSEQCVREAFEARLDAVAERERARKGALAGPHRDDLGLRLGDASLATHGSQGQQRTAVLALKVAEYEVMREASGEAPLLLLDDVLSELDDERAQAFLLHVASYEQAFVTATHRPPQLATGAHLYEVRQAVLVPEGRR